MAEADLSALRDAVVRVGAELTGTDLVGVVADEHRRQWFCRPRGWMWKEVRFSPATVCHVQDSMTCLGWRDTAHTCRMLYRLPGSPVEDARAGTLHHALRLATHLTTHTLCWRHTVRTSVGGNFRNHG